MKKITLFLLVSFITGSIFSQDTSIVNYFPTSVGNVWVFNANAGGSFCLCLKRYRTKIISSVVRNSKTYYVFQTSNYVINCVFGSFHEFFGTLDTLRVDPISGNILRYSQVGCSYSPNELLFDSLRSRKNDTIRGECGTFPYTCLDTAITSVLGTSRPTRTLGRVYVDSWMSKTYAKGIGPAFTSSGGQSCNANMTIVGCVISGVLIGDTSYLVGINQISSAIPKSFSLSQNYPNPFNPKTVIRFQVASDKFVSLKIFDALGREVETLVSQQLKPGTYEADWDGTDYPSGVYFYQLSVGNEQLATKKMVLIK